MMHCNNEEINRAVACMAIAFLSVYVVKHQVIVGLPQIHLPCTQAAFGI